jgi:hypothetical protein
MSVQMWGKFPTYPRQCPDYYNEITAVKTVTISATMGAFCQGLPGDGRLAASAQSGDKCHPQLLTNNN